MPGPGDYEVSHHKSIDSNINTRLKYGRNMNKMRTFYNVKKNDSISSPRYERSRLATPGTNMISTIY